jgi:hypothetical protein
MKKFAFVFCIYALGLSACQSTQRSYYSPPKPLEQMTDSERCSYGVRLLGHPGATAYQKAAMYEAMQNKGCFGQQQPMRIELKQM